MTTKKNQAVTGVLLKNRLKLDSYKGFLASFVGALLSIGLIMLPSHFGVSTVVAFFLSALSPATLLGLGVGLGGALFFASLYALRKMRDDFIGKAMKAFGIVVAAGVLGTLLLYLSSIVVANLIASHVIAFTSTTSGAFISLFTAGTFVYLLAASLLVVGTLATMGLTLHHVLDYIFFDNIHHSDDKQVNDQDPFSEQQPPSQPQESPDMGHTSRFPVASGVRHMVLNCPKCNTRFGSYDQLPESASPTSTDPEDTVVTKAPAAR